ncbi:hypothetical protein PC110_g15708 [Phytophthora cactorum]|uniref:NADH:flavin oxidoreductase/NADH oxidase N-terminal domain-containing protein n=1 Tax=Phytophthora cactorum TaxID=29920 RepID=A0A329RUF9_9STRA|nr:hypothetical protein PC110_g15708 [Phytophthora cactorum]
MVSAIAPKLFTPFKLGGKKAPVELKHRVVMAPLTRLRTGESGVPTALVAEYYSQRATDGGLLITEATNISPTARGYFGAPGLFNQAQIDGWEAVTKAVHDKVSSSATSVEDVHTRAVTRDGPKDHVTPRAVTVEEIPGIVADYKRAAENAIAVGFDGVEIHAANGYFLEQFLCDGVNKRIDKYGGTIENRARIIFEVADAILSSLPSSQVGIRLSPYGDTFACKDSTPAETYGYVVNKLNDYDLAYVHVIERRGMHAANVQVPEVGVARHFRDAYNGVLVSAAGYDREDALKTVEEGAADVVAFGRDFIANPDLVERLRVGADLNTPIGKTFYPQPGVPLESGYTDYPFLAEKE